MFQSKMSTLKFSNAVNLKRLQARKDETGVAISLRQLS